MSMTNEQIQALKAAAEKASTGEWIKESSDGWDAMCSDDDQANSGFIIAHFVGPDSQVNREFMQSANPSAILSLLAERAADKALIAEQAKRIAELEQRHCGGALTEREEHHVGVVNKLLERIAELEARTLTIKLPEPFTKSMYGTPLYEHVDIVAMLAAAGITLDVGE